MRRIRPGYLIGAIAATIIFTLIAVSLNSWGSSPSGKSKAWNKDATVGVTSTAEPAEATFARPSVELKASPLSNVMEVINQPVDITPTRRAESTSVVFKVPERVPLEAKDKGGKLQRSIYNAAIEVYEPSMDVWVPLETRVEGNQLIATAPHFSIFQAVWLKMGTQKVGELTVTTTPEMSPLDMLWQTGLEYLKQFAFNAIGKFDERKFDCKKLDEDYNVTLENPGKTNDFNVCVIEKDEKSSTILVKNGWAVPLHLTTDAKEGVTPDVRPSDIDLVTLIRNKLGEAFTGGAYASGLDVGSFTIDHEDAPERITVKAEASWSGAALDVTLAMLTAIFPASRLAAQSGPIIDMANCLAMAAQKNLMGTPGTDVPAKLMETAKSCMVPFVVDELKLGSFAAAFAKEARILPELVQMGQIAAMKAVTGKDPSATSARIEYTTGFEDFQGLWTYECAGSYDEFKVDVRKVDWTIRAYSGDSGRTETKTHTDGTLFRRGDKTVMIVDKTNMAGLKVGMIADLTVMQGPSAPSVDVKFSQSNRFGYNRQGGRSYC